MEILFEIVLTATTLLCSLVAGLVFTFAVVVMPGIKNLPDRDFIRSFQAMDRVIQDNHPLFMLVWVGSILAVLVTAGVGFFELTGGNRVLLMVAVFLYLLAVQLPTFAINVPLNNELQSLDVEKMSEPEMKNARETFESRWNRWNTIRTVVAAVVSVIWMVLLSAH